MIANVQLFKMMNDKTIMVEFHKVVNQHVVHTRLIQLSRKLFIT